MCGIIGYHSNKQIDDLVLINSLIHRGPDAQAKMEYTYLNSKVVFAHTRLSILDLSEKGTQPMSDEFEKITIVFNGEIYNFNDLKEKHLSNINFFSKTDTEVILNLYIKFGIDFIKMLNGDFAIAILDRKLNKIFLIRDRVGVKPLYYSFYENDFVFASELKTLFSFGIPKQIDREEIQNYFVFKYTPQDKTLVKHISRLKPGSFLTYDISTKKHEINTYWELKKIPKYENLTLKSAKKELEKIIEDAIKIRLIADVPIGNFLSGGLDSSIIAYHLKNLKVVKHFCAVKEKNDLAKEGTSSDGYFANKLAKHWDLDLHEILLNSNVATNEMIGKTIYFSDDLIADGSQIPSFLICNEARKSVKVILSGMGADEIFLGYAGHQLSLISIYYDKFPTWFRKIFSKKMSKINQGKGKFLAYRRYLHKFGNYADKDELKYAYFNIVGDYDNAISIYQDKKVKSQQIFDSYFREKNNTFDVIFKFEFENFLQKNLHYLDRMSMANGIESRVPFLDHRLIEFAYSIPREYKLSMFAKTKRILKELYSSKIPKFIIKRRKAGFGMPLRSIFSKKEEIEKLLDIEFFIKFGGFSFDNIKKICDNHINGKEDNSALIYALISFQIWCKTHDLN